MAGEIGACITIILEVLPVELRGYGTMMLMAFGHFAALIASALASWVDWRTNYFIGGGMGIGVLLLRFQAVEPAIYLKVAASPAVSRGNILKILRTPVHLARFLKGIFVATPTWFSFTILVIFAPELCSHLGLSQTIPPERYMPYYFLALVLGDITGGVAGQLLRTRKKVIVTYLCMLLLTATFYLFGGVMTESRFIFLVCLLGFFSAYTVLSFTVAAEQFGTDLRATAATSTPNLVRASAILFTATFSALKPILGIINAAALIGVLTMVIAIVSALGLEETYSKEMDYLT